MIGSRLERSFRKDFYRLDDTIDKRCARTMDVVRRFTKTIILYGRGDVVVPLSFLIHLHSFTIVDHLDPLPKYSYKTS